MAKIVQVEIQNFRGIENLKLDLTGDSSLTCFIGRGDAGKSTVLDAIAHTLTQKWNIAFSDTDFYKCDHTKEIKVRVSLIDPPEKLLSDKKFGLHIRGFNKVKNIIVDDISDLGESNGDLVPVLTVELRIDHSLEPVWSIYNERDQEEKEIRSHDRSSFNCFLLSDYVDRHFSWNRGNPLYALLSATDDGQNNNNVVIDCLRNAKKEIDGAEFRHLDAVTDLVKSKAKQLGLDIDPSTTLDAREISMKDGRVSLHDEIVPFRQKGKGSRRLASIAIQTALVQEGGIVLIDEIEQGLEPDRIKHVVSSLVKIKAGQALITTHSRDAITELSADNLMLLIKDEASNIITPKSLDLPGDALQKTVRACPEAFFAKKVIVCEGSTEVGVCRALDIWRQSNPDGQMSLKDCAYVNGEGSSLIQRVREISGAGIKTAFFCDSDRKDVNSEKQDWREKGVSIFDCDDKLCIEEQVFKDAPWELVIKLLRFIQKTNGDSFRSKFSNEPSTDVSTWEDSKDLRNRICLVFRPIEKGKEGAKWLKGIYEGQVLGELLFQHIESMDDQCRLKCILVDMNTWIDEPS